MRCTLVITWPSFPLNSFILKFITVPMSMFMWMLFSMYEKCKHIFSLWKGDNCNSNKKKVGKTERQTGPLSLEWIKKDKPKSCRSHSHIDNDERAATTTTAISINDEDQRMCTCHCQFICTAFSHPFHDSQFGSERAKQKNEIDQNPHAERKWKICHVVIFLLHQNWIYASDFKS